MKISNNRLARRFIDRVKYVDPFELGNSALLVLLAVYFSLPIYGVLSQGIGHSAGHFPIITSTAVIYAAIGVACFMFSYIVASRFRVPGNTPNLLRYEWNRNRVWIVFIALFGGGFLIKIVRIAMGQHLSNLYLDPNDQLFLFKFMISLNALHYMGIAVAFVYYIHLLKENDPHYKAWQYIAWSTTAMALVFGFLSVTGRLALITPILIYLISKHYLHNRSLRRIVLVSGLVLFVLFPVKMFLRDIPSALNQYFISSHTGFSHAYKDKSYHDPIGGIFYSGFLEPERYVDVQVNFGNVRDLAADSTIGRIGQLHVFSVIINNTHEYVYGRNIPYLLNHVGVPNSLIERFAGIGPGTEFGIKNGFVINTWTGVAPTQMGDLYINFGMPGIVFGMMVLGYLFRRIFESLASSPYPSGIFIYSILWIVMMHGLEQSLSAAYGKALQIFLIMVAIQFFISCVPLFGKARILGRQSPSA